ncbi:MAG: isoamylase early set domain-containing protein [Desulfobacterales bacterium]|nr:MAG: isoamylase early set domain-containing protein [Desulfobacterales bacterium]
MFEKKFTAKPKRRRITFSLESPEAQEVILLADFNRWDPKIHPMQKDKDGIWRKIVMVFPGRYEYRFLVDGKWFNDPQNDEKCSNCYGSQNNILNVNSK